jgi:hypothetical protein
MTLLSKNIDKFSSDPQEQNYQIKVGKYKKHIK